MHKNLLTKFTIKTVQKLHIEGNYLDIITNPWETHGKNYSQRWKTESFPLRSRTRQGCPFSPLLFNIVLKVLAMAIREEKEIKEIKVGKEDIKFSLFADHMILYTQKNLQTPPENYQS